MNTAVLKTGAILACLAMSGLCGWWMCADTGADSASGHRQPASGSANTFVPRSEEDLHPPISEEQYALAPGSMRDEDAGVLPLPQLAEVSSAELLAPRQMTARSNDGVPAATPVRFAKRDPALIFTSRQPGLRTPAEASPLNAEGQLRGTLGVVDLDDGSLVGAGSVHLYFLKDQSQVEATVDDSGGFQAKLVEEGEYAMIAAGEQGILAFSVEVERPGGEARRQGAGPFLVHFRNQNELTIQAAIVANDNLAPLSTILMDEGLPTIRNSLLSSPYTYTASDREPAEAEPVSVDEYEIQMRSFGDGTVGLRGYTDREVDETSLRAYFLQDGREILSVDVESDGTFEARGLPAGVLSLVVAGSKGVAAFSLLASLPPLAARPESSELVREVSFRQPQDAELDVDLYVPRVDEQYLPELADIIRRHVPLDNLPALRDALGGTDLAGAPGGAAGGGGAPAAAGGGGGGSGGGGGGGLGGGGFGAAVVAAAVAAGASGNGFVTPVPRPAATPFKP